MKTRAASVRSDDARASPVPTMKASIVIHDDNGSRLLASMWRWDLNPASTCGGPCVGSPVRRHVSHFREKSGEQPEREKGRETRSGCSGMALPHLARTAEWRVSLEKH